MTTDHKSALAAAIEAQPRAAHCFRLEGFYKAGGKVVPAVAVLRANISERDDAAWAAHKYVADGSKRAGEGAAEAKTDTDITIDAKNVELLYRLCREVDPASIAAAPDKPEAWKPLAVGSDANRTWAAFPGPQWMRDHLSSDQLAQLLALVVEVQRREAPDAGAIDDDAVEAVVKLCQDHAADDIPEAILDKFARTKLTHLIVLISVKLAQARLSVDTLLSQMDALEKLAQAKADAVPDAEQ